MKVRINTIDLHTMSFKEEISEGTDPADCYTETFNEATDEDHNAVKAFYQERMKVNESGGWIIVCEDTIITITELVD